MGKSCGKKDATDNTDDHVDLQLAPRLPAASAPKKPSKILPALANSVAKSKAGDKRKERSSSPAEEAKKSKVTPPNAAGTKRKERASRPQTLPPPDAKKAKKANNTNQTGPRQIVAGLTGYAACANGVYVQQDEEKHNGHPLYTVQPL